MASEGGTGSIGLGLRSRLVGLDMAGAMSIRAREHYGGGGATGCCTGAASRHDEQRVSVMHGHGAACLVHDKRTVLCFLQFGKE